MNVGVGNFSSLSCQFYYSWKLQILCVLAKKKVIAKYNDLIVQVFDENSETYIIRVGGIENNGRRQGEGSSDQNTIVVERGRVFAKHPW